MKCYRRVKDIVQEGGSVSVTRGRVFLTFVSFEYPGYSKSFFGIAVRFVDVC